MWGHLRAIAEYLSGFEDLIEHVQRGESPSHPGYNLTHWVSRCASCYMAAFINRCKHRKEFLTSSGPLGLGNERIQPNDELVVLIGGGLPFLLRKQGDDHSLVCPCYVEGITDGEAWRGEDDERLETWQHSVKSFSFMHGGWSD